MRENKDIQTVYVGAVDNYAYRLDRMPTIGEFDGRPMGGHLCGYVKLPHGHPCEYRTEEELYEKGIHSITYAEDEPDGFWIGYDFTNNPYMMEGSVILRLEAMIDKLKEI